MRPNRFEDVTGQDHLFVLGSPLLQLASPEDELSIAVPSSIILWGPPGTGKTTIALAVAKQSGRTFIQLNAVSSGVKEVRDAVAAAHRERVDYGRGTLLFIDEIHRFSRSQQDSLLAEVENGSFVLIAATTENPSISVNAPLLSRCVLLELKALSAEQIEEVLGRALASPNGYNGKVRVAEGILKSIAVMASGDARKGLVMLETLAGFMLSTQKETISEDEAFALLGAPSYLYDKNSDHHYDVISAFIKSVRGSDADAALHYLARMLESGEDPRFISRRLMILAAEDVGLADPQALVLSTSAAQTVALIGMPEARIVLSEVTIYLAMAPKSNSAYLAIEAALQDIRDGALGEVPSHLRNTYPKSLKKNPYKYPHDEIQAISEQTYLPENLVDKKYFKPKSIGFEESLSKRWPLIRKILGRD